MKKIILWTLVVIGVVLGGYVLFNLIDAPRAPGIYKQADLKLATFEKSNGYYALWTLFSPPSRDVNSDEVIAKISGVFDPSGPYEKNAREWEAKGGNKQFMEDFGPKAGGSKNEILMNLIRMPVDQLTDWGMAVWSKRDVFHQEAEKLRLYLARFTEMIGRPVFADFSFPKISCPLPNLLAWLRLSKIYVRLHLLNAKEGNWRESTDNLIRHTQFCLRAIQGSRILLVNLVARATLSESVYALNSVLNQAQCPPELAQLVLDQLPPLTYEQYGSRNSIKGEFIFVSSATRAELTSAEQFNFLERWLIRCLTQKNRTTNEAFAYFKKIGELEQTPPYRWPYSQSELPKRLLPDRGFFWWLQNPGGKITIERFYRDGLNFFTVIHKVNRSKALMDMLRISAEVHLRYDAKLSVQENLNLCQSYRELTDLCSGKPYRWNDKKQLLYSIGTDRRDNGGKVDTSTMENTDFALPVILFVH